MFSPKRKNREKERAKKKKTGKKEETVVSVEMVLVHIFQGILDILTFQQLEEHNFIYVMLTLRFFLPTSLTVIREKNTI